jgi:hypothetical protein
MWRALALVVLASGCLTAPGRERATPLYPASEPPARAAELATLDFRRPGGSAPVVGSASFIRSVDGRDVSTFPAPFALLPGCHVVETAGRQVTAAKALSYVGDVGARVFPFRMRAGHEYTVVEEYAETTGPIVNVSVHAVERDAAGRQTQEIAAASGEADLQSCRAWTPPAS